MAQPTAMRTLSALTSGSSSASLTTFSQPFNRFAPLGFRRFVRVGIRMVVIPLSSSSSSSSPELLLYTPISLTPEIKIALNKMGKVRYIMADLGHHLYVKDYVKEWPEVKLIGVSGLERKQKGLRWDFIYSTNSQPPEKKYDFADIIETRLFEGFVTLCFAVLHKPSKTLIVSDLLMNLPCVEQKTLGGGPMSRFFNAHANPYSYFFKALIYSVAGLDFPQTRVDAQAVRAWDFERIVMSHGEVIEGESAKAAWTSAYEWYLVSNEEAAKRKNWFGDWFWKRGLIVARRLFLE